MHYAGSLNRLLAMKYLLCPRALMCLIYVCCVAVPISALAQDEHQNKRIAKQVDSVFSTMSLREKVAQLFIVDFVSNNGIKVKSMQNRLVRNEKVGGLITMNDKMVPALQRLNELNRFATIPLLVSIDGEWGVSMRYKEIPSFPKQMQLGALTSESLIYKMGYAIGKECLALKIHVNFAPDVDINNNPDNPAINTRSFGEDRDKVARYGAAYMLGMKDAGVAGSAKHFPGHGDTDIDSHKGLPELLFNYARLDSLELYPFRYLIDKGVDMVMVGHLKVPAIDTTGRPASISKPIITDFLRGKMCYKGIICTDALNMDGVAKSCGLEKKQIPLEAYKAGADILLMAQDVENAIGEIEKAIKNGELAEQELDIKVRKMLVLKARMGLFNKNYSPLVNIHNIEKKVINEDNIALINKLAKNTITVVTNGDKQIKSSHILPLRNITNKKIAYLGYCGENFGKEFAQTLMKYTTIDTIILRSPVTQKKLEEAKHKLLGYDLIITSFNNTDFRPQRNFGIDSLQVDFITNWAAEQPMIAVYFGSPYALNKLIGYQNFKAFILGYTNTLANNFAAAQVIFGGTPAIGVLPVSTAKFKAGESVILPYKTRLGYYNFEYNKHSYSMYNGVIYGTDSVGRAPILLKETSPLITIVPLIGTLIEQGKIKSTTLLGDILKLPIERHNNILVSDLLNHRSGLPAVHGGFNFSRESVLNLPLEHKTLPEYSAVNIYYLRKILEEFYPKSTNEIFKNTSSILRKLEMQNTLINEEQVLQTTLEDLSKFYFMIFNNGMYNGSKVLPVHTAELIKMLLPYYSINSNGLRIIPKAENVITYVK